MKWLREHPELVIILAFVTFVAIIYLGVAPAEHWPPFNSSPSPTPTTALGTKNSGPTQAAPASAISPGPTSAGPAAFKTWHVGITFSGIDFDTRPPGPGSDVIVWERYTNELTAGGTSIIISRYAGSQGLPTEAECRTWAMSHNSQIVTGVNPGDRLCFISQNGRTVRFIVTSISSDAVVGRATVWNDGNQ
jgi:hypothetical protein